MFRKYYGQIYSICLSILKNPHDAEEVASDAFLHAYLKIDQLSNPDKFLPWLKKTACNRSKDFLRNRRKEAMPLVKTKNLLTIYYSFCIIRSKMNISHQILRSISILNF